VIKGLVSIPLDGVGDEALAAEGKPKDDLDTIPLRDAAHYHLSPAIKQEERKGA
jgi:hypothetical protein